MLSENKQFSLNIFSGWFAYSIFLLTNFILLPYLIKNLSTESFGVYQLARSSVMFFMFLQLGMGPSLVRFFSKAIANKSLEEVRNINGSALMLLSIIGIIGSLLLIILIPFFLDFYNVSYNLRNDSISLLVCLSISLFFNIIVIVPKGIIVGLNKYNLANNFDALYNLTHLILTVSFFILFKPSLLYAGIAILIPSIIRFIILLLICEKKIGNVFFGSFKYAKKDCLKSLLNFSPLIFCNVIAITLISQGPILLIGKFQEAEMIASYAIIVLLANGVQSLLNYTAQPLTTLASRYTANNNIIKLKEYSILMAKVIISIGFFATIVLFIFGTEIMRLWIGKELIWVWKSVTVMVFGITISSSQTVNYYLALGGGNIKPTVYSNIITSLFTFVGILIGLYFYNWNIMHIVNYIVFLMVLQNILYLSYKYSLEFLYSYKKYLLSVYFLPIFILLTFMIITFLTKEFINPTFLLSSLLFDFIIIILFLIVCWNFIVPKKIIRKILKNQ